MSQRQPFGQLVVLAVPALSLHTADNGLNALPKNQPELNWDYGYYYALILMVVSAVAPFIYFKRRGWL